LRYALGLLLVPDEVLRTRTTWRRQLLNARSDLLDIDVGEVLGSGATLDVGGLFDIDDGFSHVGGFPTNLRGMRGDARHPHLLDPVPGDTEACGDDLGVPRQ
jgi:hypothetical protein